MNPTFIPLSVNVRLDEIAEASDRLGASVARVYSTRNADARADLLAFAAAQLDSLEEAARALRSLLLPSPTDPSWQTLPPSPTSDSLRYTDEPTTPDEPLLPRCKPATTEKPTP